MAKYFKHYPTDLYTLEDRPQALDLVTNICTRFTFEKSFKENTSMYYDYQIQEGETAEMIAHKLYGSPEMHWVIFMINDIIDPYFDWPMNNNVFKQFLNTKYAANAGPTSTGVKWCTTNIKSYYLNEKRTVVKTGATVTESFEVDFDTWDAFNANISDTTLDTGEKIIIEGTKSTKSYYNYEVEENEKRRKIKLIKPDIAGMLSKQFRKVIT